MLRKLSVAAVVTSALTLLGCGANSTTADATSGADQSGDNTAPPAQANTAQANTAQANTAQANTAQVPGQADDPNAGATPSESAPQGSAEVTGSSVQQGGDEAGLIDVVDFESDAGDCVQLFCDGGDLHERQSCFERFTRFLEACEFGCVDGVEDAHCASEPRAEGGAPDGGPETVVPAEQVGSVAQSCGAVNRDDGVEVETKLVDCTAFGDEAASCVFSNHCWCSEGFHCEGSDPHPDAGTRPECGYGVACVPN